jgi:anti-sigma B factor antagonist
MAFSSTVSFVGNVAEIAIDGELDASSAPAFRERIEEAASHNVSKLVIIMSGLTYMASAGLRVLIFAKQKMGTSVEIVLVGLQDTVKETLELTGFHHSVTVVESYDRG